MTIRKGVAVLSKSEHGCLMEALRRRLRFFDNPSGGSEITKHWTGLGSKSAYKQAVASGFMEVATSDNPGHMTWWRLTEKGARIVAYWIGKGFTYEAIERDDFAVFDQTIPLEIL